MGIIDKIVKPFTAVAEKGIDKITSDKERLEQTNELLKNTSGIDLKQLEARNNINIKNARFWLEIICVIGFAYSYLLAPMLNDVFSLSLKGAGDATKELLYALMGLGGYRLAEKVVKK